MRFIPTRVHGIIDYLSAALLIASPWLFGFADGGLDTWLAVAVGVSVAVMSAFTRYELGLVRRIDMRTHLTIDAITSTFLAASPWLFGFHVEVWAPHLAIGLFGLGVSQMSMTHPPGSSAAPVQRRTQSVSTRK